MIPKFSIQSEDLQQVTSICREISEQGQKDWASALLIASKFHEENQRIALAIREGCAAARLTMAKFQEEFLSTIAAAQKSIDALNGRFRETHAILAEDIRITDMISDLGFVPHIELRRQIEYSIEPIDSDQKAFAESIAKEIWPELRRRLQLQTDECLPDEKILDSFAEMLQAHEFGLYQLIMPAAVQVIERSVLLAKGSHARDRKIFNWLKDDAAHLPCPDGIHGYRVWLILVERTFANCGSDLDADALDYPNRHAAAHGFGAKTATIVDSLNAILITHFVVALTSEAHFERERASELA
jgi:hypothetical protein